MTVYVDEPRLYSSYRTSWGNRVNRAHTWCHLLADEPAELHRFALRLGMKRAWFQDRPGFPHYDLMGEGMRAKALAAGAVVMGTADYLKWIRERRTRGTR